MLFHENETESQAKWIQVRQVSLLSGKHTSTYTLNAYIQRRTSELVENAKLNLDQPPFCVLNVEYRSDSHADSNQSIHFMSRLFAISVVLVTHLLSEFKLIYTSNLQLNETFQYKTLCGTFIKNAQLESKTTKPNLIGNKYTAELATETQCETEKSTHIKKRWK